MQKSTSIKLKSYQKTAIKFGLRKKQCALFIDPGMGKTAIALAIIKLLKREKKIRKVLVIAELNIIYETWPDELQKWTQFNDLTHTILHGPEKEANLERDCDLYFINPEGLKWLCDTYFDHDLLVIDESSKFKNSQAKRFKLLKKELEQFDYRILMSGTPAPNSLQDLFGQMYLVDKGTALGEYVTTFRAKYFYTPNRYSYRILLKPGAEAAIHRRIEPRAFVLQNLKIAKPIFNYIKVRLPAKAQRQYNSMEQKLFSEIENESPVLAMSAASAHGKCRQIANGALYGDSKPKYHPIHTAKLAALRGLFEELQGKPLLIGYWYQHDLQQLKSIFPGADHIGGDVPQNKRGLILRKWNAGHTTILLGQIGSISHGLNLQKSGCADICYFSLTDDLDAYEQFYRRVYGRHGSKKYVRVHHIVARNTVDEATLIRLRSKAKQQLTLKEAIMKYKELKMRKKEFR